MCPLYIRKRKDKQTYNKYSNVNNLDARRLVDPSRICPPELMTSGDAHFTDKLLNDGMAGRSSNIH